MLRQRVENPRPGGLWGVALVLGVAAAVALSSRLFGWLSRWLGVWASAGFIASGCALAWFLMYWYVLSYGYSLDGSRLEVVRRYGRYERMATQVWLSRVQAVGEPGASAFLAALPQGLCYIPLVFLLPWLFGVTGILLTPLLAYLLTDLITIPFERRYFRG